MRIAFIHPSFPSANRTGATHSATRIVEGLANTGHDITVYCTQKPEFDLQNDDIELKHLSGNSHHPHTRTRLNQEVVARIDELKQFDIVHSYLMRLIPSVAKVGQANSVSTIVTLNAYGGVCAKNDLLYLDEHKCENKSLKKCLNCIVKSDNDQNLYSNVYRTLSRLFSLRLVNLGEKNIDSIDAFHALSPHVESIYSKFGWNEDSIYVVPNISDPKFNVEHISDFNEPLHILYVGYLKKSKGAHNLIPIFSNICDLSEKEFELTIIGKGELDDLIKKQISESSLSDNINFEGWVSYADLPEVYASHDLFLYPGQWDEPFGRVFLESMAAGTPIVATNVGSVADIIGDAGIITEQSIEELSKGVIEITSQNNLSKYSDCAKNEISCYESDHLIPRFNELYYKISG
jgi:glycosyltransferase involved in cell wall biosynthesis